MIRLIHSAGRLPVPIADDRSAADVARMIDSWYRWRKVFDPYRPELHYMRGPGPKWRERHARSSIEGPASLMTAEG
jgi:hypothetical protein